MVLFGQVADFREEQMSGAANVRSRVHTGVATTRASEPLLLTSVTDFANKIADQTSPIAAGQIIITAGIYTPVSYKLAQQCLSSSPPLQRAAAAAAALTTLSFCVRASTKLR